VTIGHSSGSTISNLNGSCRVGTGSTNAGTLTAGTGTATYNVSGETNGLHLSSNNLNSATFNWTAPAAGTGTVRLYIAGLQGGYSGQNTRLVVVSNETAAAPGVASDPHPADQAEDVTPGDSLWWTEGTGTTLNIIYFGTSNPPDSVTVYGLPVFYGAHTIPGTTYYWRVDEQNSAGITPGPVWQFTTLALPDTASNPFPANGDTAVAVRVTLAWQADGTVWGHDVYLGTTNPPPLVSAEQSGNSYPPPQNLEEGTVYYWRVNEINNAGVTVGPVWSFRTESPNAAGGHGKLLPSELALGPVYPNPFNATVTIPFALPQAAKVTVALYDVTGRQVALMAGGSFAAGEHSLQWSSEGVASGVYLVRLTAGNRTLTTKVIALK
jgi:hypothetical protein